MNILSCFWDKTLYSHFGHVVPFGFSHGTYYQGSYATTSVVKGTEILPYKRGNSCYPEPSKCPLLSPHFFQFPWFSTQYKGLVSLPFQNPAPGLHTASTSSDWSRQDHTSLNTTLLLYSYMHVWVTRGVDLSVSFFTVFIHSLHSSLSPWTGSWHALDF